MKQAILISLIILFIGCATTDKISGNMEAGANDDSQYVDGEIHYQLFEW